jgi:CBS domain-containing protein
MPVGDHCRRRFSLVRADETIREAAIRMRDEATGCLVVVDEKKRPIGMLTDRDVIMQTLRRARDPEKTLVGDVMHDEITTLWETTPLLTAFRRMRADGLRRIPVIDPEGRAIGVMEWDDAVQIIAAELDQAARVAQANVATSGS